jgi:exodeoxyribonuclease-5
MQDDMHWSAEQEHAIRSVRTWLKDTASKQVFRLFGYAGTGKTTLAKHLAAELDYVIFAAFTGKAAHVLSTKGCEGARTIHSLIYIPDEDGDFDVRFRLNRNSDVQDADLVIIDECSMVDQGMGQDLLSFGVPVLVLGDPAQLPPISGAGFFTGQEPDLLLTKVHRQAEGSPIIELATRARQGLSLDAGWYGDSYVGAARQAPNVKSMLGVSQVLVGRNVTRRMVNRQCRAALGYESELPLPGDRVVCLRNNHELGLLNGTTWTVLDVEPSKSKLRVVMHVRSDDDPEFKVRVAAHADVFQGADPRQKPWYERQSLEEFDYGYALTVHKAQGSQWPSVLLYDESFCFREDAHRWLYTGLTRAAESVLVARP